MLFVQKNTGLAQADVNFVILVIAVLINLSFAAKESSLGKRLWGMVSCVRGDVLAGVSIQWKVLFFFFNLFIFGCVGSSLLCVGFL